MKIQRKLIMSYALIIVLFTAIGAVLVVNTLEMSQLQDNATHQEEIGNYAHMYQQGFYMRELGQALGNGGTPSSDTIRNIQVGFNKTKEAGDYLINNLPQDSQLYTVFYKCYEIDQNVISPLIPSDIGSTTDAIQLPANVSSDEVARTTSIIAQAQTQIDGNLTEFQALVQSNIQDANTQSQNYANFSLVFTVTGFTIIVIVSVVMALVISKRITNPLKKLTDIAGKVSVGELDQQINITSKDEIGDLGQAFQRMINAFKMSNAMNQEVAENDA